MDLHDSVIVITGASRGLGRELALHFAGTAHKLVLVARSETALNEVADEVRERGSECACYPADLSDRAAVAVLTARLAANEPDIDVLINNAADVTSKPMAETSDDEIEALVRTNLLGPLLLTRHVATTMAERGRGCIVNISSLAGYKPNPSQTVYSITKNAVNGMSDALRAEFGRCGVHVMNVALMSIGEGPRQIAPKAFAHRLQRAIEREETELYLSSFTKWLMRLYRFCPPLARLT